MGFCSRQARKISPRLCEIEMIIRLLLLFAFTCLLATVPTGRAVVLPPDGGYPGSNTEKGEQASELRKVSTQLQISDAAAQEIASNP